MLQTSLEPLAGHPTARMFAEVSDPSTFGSYNVHNVLAGSNILIWVCFVGLAVFLNPKPKLLGGEGYTAMP